ncbi:glutathione S-transferase [Chloropicon primus]|uniref:Glutathione S-transferase n=1 Tax=Chloropicon primus TaxID=1764295 RepID=A0A5B8MMG0_9CHLO|nr:hypothetical protein A3770_06p42440 [Chloropicon primus]UPR00948.1 glutathione S-transferase [Chloropicon primus]|mmetsp:Transcript_5117/g.15397  ORF Transcript_5117/g.15397 Transcript_5117/m.15397 type:complete len:252 (-) Transcript_5117:20-775(-)|eukprot:QDZ21726.1 hypothetical protein A3770_06p42440 [Chloropicon primus]
MYQLYVDFMSQPSRALMILCRLNAASMGQALEEKRVLIHKKEHRTDEYKELNPLRQVPCLVKRGAGQSVDFRLPESCAILRHLCERFSLSDWYPSAGGVEQLEKQAYVDSALHWYHSTLRKGCGGLTFHKVVAMNLGVQPNEAIAVDCKAVLDRALGTMERVWLKDRSFVGGSRPCVADLLFCCELEQLNMFYAPVDGMDFDSIMGPFPEVRAWMARVAEATSPVYEEVHKFLRFASKMRHEKLSKVPAKL